MINKILAAVSFLIGLAFYFFKQGKDNEKNKQKEKRLKTYEEAKKTDKYVKNLNTNDVNNELIKLLDD